MSEAQCDFCNSREIAWRYRAESFVIDTLMTIQGKQIRFPWGSEGDWAACEFCSNLIETDKWEELADHSTQTSPFLELLRPSEISGLRVAIAQLHQTFNQKRIGQRMRGWEMPKKGH